MKSASIVAIVVGLILLVAIVLCVRWFEGRLVFFPSVRWDARLEDYSPAREIPLEAGDGVSLSSVWLRHDEPRVVLLYCHGNAGNLSHRLSTADRWRRQFQISVLIFDYRGYGRSEGNPTEEGIFLDGLAALEQARELAHGVPVVIYGRSLGTVPATRLAGSRGAAGLILDSPLANAREMAGQVLPIPGIGALTSFSLDNVAAVREVTCPLLIIHGEEDRIIPSAQAEKVFQAVRGPKQLLLLPREGHNEERSGREFSQAFDGFLGSVVTPD